MPFTDTLKTNSTKPVILFDGVCNFCNATVNFIIRHDPDKTFLFSPIQAREARALLREKNIAFINLKTVYLVDNNEVYQRSEAVFKMFQKLPYPWKLLSLLRIFPLFITDFFYKTIAKYRYSWFGKSDEVVKPDEKISERFLV